ncbi:MAG: amino acid adenylation domain-containing protein, partial [Vulcanimicrobiaceae bacterium]
HVTYRKLWERDTVSKDKSPIGSRIPDLRVYVLDSCGDLAPIGVGGEIYVGGGGVARGYLNRPDLTQQRFVADPFIAGERFYKTGDLARYSAQGELEFLGRNDFQVKIRGFRIELGEIEARLEEFHGVLDAVVLVREENDGEKSLVAYYLAADNAAISIDALRSHLLALLPDYMVPAAYIAMDQMPLTANGKLDRLALPAPERNSFIVRGYEEPANNAEKVIARIWSELLRVDRVGRRDNFFELGGHSLLAMRMVERMRAQGLHADVRALFDAPTLAGVAASVLQKSVDEEIPPNRIPAECQLITPDMVPLVELCAVDIERIVSSVSGGSRNIADIYPLSPLQEGILFHHLLTQDGDPYLTQASFRFNDRSNLDAFVVALQAVIDRHEILRSSLQWEGLPEPVQVVWATAPLTVVSIEGVEAFDPQRYRMNLKVAPLIHVGITRETGTERWLLVLLIHHLVSDHVGLEIIQSEILAYLSGRGEGLPAPVPFRNFVARMRLRSATEHDEEFFTRMLCEVSEPTTPFDLRDVHGVGSEIVEARSVIDADCARRLRASARRLGVSSASLWHVAWARVISAASAKLDVVFGTVLLGRLHAGEGAGQALGLFINTLPIRITLGEVGVEECVRRTHTLLAELMHHEHASLSLAQKCSSVPAPNPLFSAILNYRHSSPSENRDNAQEWNGIEAIGGRERTNYPLTLSIDDLGEKFYLNVQVHSSQDPHQICGLVEEAIDQLVSALELEPERPIRFVRILPGAQREKLLNSWNSTAASYTTERCIHELFEARVLQAPDAIATSFEDQNMTYGELNAEANRLAHELRTIGVRPDTMVAIIAERSIEMVVALIATLKAGGAYMPLDGGYPLERLRFMLDDAKPTAILLFGLRNMDVRDAVVEIGVPVLDLSNSARWRAQSAENPSPGDLTSANLAYTIYTSGSTGLPKGVMIEHQSVVNRILWMQNTYGLTDADSVLQKTPFTFDVSVWEFFWPLLVGAKLVLARPDGHKDANYLSQLIELEGITTLHFVPSMLAAFLDSGSTLLGRSVKRVFCSGEALAGPLVRRLRDRWPDAKCYNLYGPTEACVDVTAWDCNGNEVPDNVPIGTPISNVRAYILDMNAEPVPIGVAGELYLGGVQVARGYLNRPDLTGQRFLSSPFVDGDRLYRTGDVVRYRPDGNIVFLGRNDSQVKIRGLRIELGEIEARLLDCAEIRETIVIAREDRVGEKRLVAYFTARDENAVDLESLRASLLSVLPEYMVPAAYVALSDFPLTTSGKLDRNALPLPDAEAYVKRVYEAPRVGAESVIACIWSEMLEVERVGRQDNFFELGGHSLLALRMIERMRVVGLHSDVRTLFASPSLEKFASEIGGNVTVEVPPNLIASDCEAITPSMLPLIALESAEIESVVATVPGGARNVQDIYPLAPLQEGILYHHLIAGRQDPYLMRALFRFTSHERLDAFVAALNAVILRHDILRTAVLWEGLPEPVQVVWRHAAVTVEDVSIDPTSDAAQQLTARFGEGDFSIDVRSAPLLRVVAACDHAKGGWLLLLVFHHLIDDNTSLKMLQSEIQLHLLGKIGDLPKPVPFRNFVAQARLGVSKQEHEAYFRRTLGDITEPTIPFGLTDVHTGTRALKQARHRLDIGLSARLRERARELGIGVASLHHLAWARVLGAIAASSDVVFGTVLFGRMHGGEGIDRAMGLFINTLPVRVRIDETPLEESARQTHATLSELMHHEHAPLSLAQRCSALPQSTPLFTALLNYRNLSPANENIDSNAAWDGIEALGGEERTNYPIALSIDDVGARFYLTAQVDASLDPQYLCELVASTLSEIAENLERTPGVPLSSVRVHSEADRTRILTMWNGCDAPYRSDLCVHELFETAVSKAPHSLAVAFEGRNVTYADLNARANRLARHLRTLGVQPNQRVGLCVQRSIDMIVGVLAVLKAGGAYVPLDPGYPLDRLQYMVGDCAPVLILTHRDVPDTTRLMFRSTETPVVDIDVDELDWEAQPPTNPDCIATPTDLAYVIYTSGSTGAPKGVMVEHHALCNLSMVQSQQLEINERSRVLQCVSFSFDFSVLEFVLALTHGASLHIISHRSILAGPALVSTIKDHGISHAVLSPALLSVLPDDADLSPLRVMMVGGEAPSLALVKRFAHGRRFVNTYGPAECTVFVSLHDCDPEYEGIPPIGRPIPNVRMYVLDSRREPVPMGVIGELYIGGAQVARGYLNQPDLTQERFVVDPFDGKSGARMYKSGDLVRCLPNGNLEFVGRNDSQVKLRGFRIELGEIEARLTTHLSVREAVVLLNEDVDGEKRLHAYYTMKPLANISGQQLRKFLQSTLPEYMIPAIYFPLEQMPLTPNGKLDRIALSSMRNTIDENGLNYEAPISEDELAVSAI